MAKYPISNEGAQAFRQLGQKLTAQCQEIESHGRSLKSTISGLGDLGKYKNEIDQIVDEIDQANKRGRDSVEQLSGKLSNLASRVESVLNKKLG